MWRLIVCPDAAERGWMGVAASPIWNFKCAESWRWSDTTQWIDRAIESCPITLCKYRINFYCFACQFPSICGGARPRSYASRRRDRVRGVAHFSHFALSKSAMIYVVHLTPSRRLPSDKFVG